LTNPCVAHKCRTSRAQHKWDFIVVNERNDILPPANRKVVNIKFSEGGKLHQQPACRSFVALNGITVPMRSAGNIIAIFLERYFIQRRTARSNRRSPQDTFIDKISDSFFTIAYRSAWQHRHEPP